MQLKHLNTYPPAAAIHIIAVILSVSIVELGRQHPVVLLPLRHPAQKIRTQPVYDTLSS